MEESTIVALWTAFLVLVTMLRSYVMRDLRIKGRRKFHMAKAKKSAKKSKAKKSTY